MKTSTLLQVFRAALLSVLAVAATTAARAQATPATYPTWAQSYGVGTYDGTGTTYADNPLYSSGFDFPAGIARMPDGGVVVAGNVAYPFEHSGHTEDVEQPTLVRYKTDGNILWQVTLPVPSMSATNGTGTEYATCTVTGVTTDAQGNIFIAYQASSFTEDNGSLPGVAKFGPGGNLLWQTALGVTVFIPMPDGNGGTTPMYGGGSSQPGYALNVTADGGVVFGTTDYYTGLAGYSPAFTKLNADGSLAMHRPFDQPGTGDIACQSADGTAYVLVIEHGIVSNSGGAGLTLVLTDANFNPTAERTFDAESGFLQFATSLQATSDGGYVMSSVGSQRYTPNITILRKLNADLTPAWEKVFNNLSANTTVLSGGGFLLAGSVELDASLTGGVATAKPVLLRLDATGQLQSAFAFGGMNDDSVATSGGAVGFSPVTAVQTTDGGIAFTTDSESFYTGPLNGVPDWWTVKLDPNFRVQDFNGVMTPFDLTTFTEHDNTGTNEVTDIAGDIQQYYDHVQVFGDALGAPTDPSAYPTPNAPTVVVQADTVTRAVLPLPGALTINTVQPPETDSTWTFTATQASTVSGLTMSVQYSFTPAIENSWTTLPGGGQMTRGTGGNSATWTLVTTSVPVSTGSNDPNLNNDQSEAFRAIASASGYDDATGLYSAFYQVGPDTHPVYNGPTMLTTAVGDNFTFDAFPDFTNGVNQVTPLDPAPPGLSYTGDHNYLTGNPTQVGTYTLRFTATEPVGNRPTTATVTLTVTSAPAITSPLTATATEGQPFTYQITASNLAAPVSYTASGLPDNLDYSISSGIISGTPAIGSAKVYSVQIVATDASNDTAQATLTLTINPVGTATPTPTPTPPPPSPTPIPTPTPTPTPAGPTSDLTLIVGYSPTQVNQNDPVTYHFTVFNHGPAAATGVRVVITKDPNESFISQGSTTVTVGDNGLYTVTVGNLDASGTGASASFDVVFRANAGGTLALNATVYEDNTDPNPADNAATETLNAVAGTPAAHAPTINAPAGGTIIVGEPFAYQITTLGDVPVDSFDATSTPNGLPDGLTVDTASGVISGTVANDATLGTVSFTLSASNGAGRSTTTRTFSVVAAPEGKSPDVTGTLSGLKIKAPAGDGTSGKYKISGAFTLANLGKKPAKNVAVGLYLSNSPDFSFPAVANDSSISQVGIYLDTTDPAMPALRLTPAGGTTLTAALPGPLAKRGAAGSSLGPVPFSFKVAAKRVNTAEATYRYLLVVIDPANKLSEPDKTNNVIAIDLQQQTE